MPETRYARSGDVSIAYQVFGAGPRDLVVVPGWISHLEVFWDDPALRTFLERLGSFARVLLFDKRGTGLSDRVSELALPSLEERIDDARAVMDAAGSEEATLLGWSEGGPMCVLFAATHPHRVSSLVLFGSAAKFERSEENPHGIGPERMDELERYVENDWGSGEASALMAPGHAADARFRAWWGRYERLSASPSAARALLAMGRDVDVRHVLPAVGVPTLVVHRSGDPWVPVELGRALASGIPSAKYVELASPEHPIWLGDRDGVLDEVEEFLTGARTGTSADRVLATVLFTDIVDSTRRAAELGDRGWREVLERHDALVRERLRDFRGREVSTTGDGFVATFDGPARAIRCASDLARRVSELGLSIRAGLHAGEIELADGDVHGIAVHIAARVLARAAPGEVLVSSTVRDLVAGSGIAFDERGATELKGVPGEWRLYAVRG